jgi:hypothetical protein
MTVRTTRVTACAFMLDWNRVCGAPVADWPPFAGRPLCAEHQDVDRLSQECRHLWAAAYCSHLEDDDVCLLCDLRADEREWQNEERATWHPLAPLEGP